jgi:molybdate transport repressor ModE-like protein
MLNLNRLRVLAAVARHGSFSAAADHLHLSQPAVSQQVATLEREVGMPLLERTSEGPKLTDAGRALVGHAEAAAARLEEAEHELAAIAGLERGELRIASFPTASAALLLPAVREFSQAHPGVRLHITDAEPEDALPGLRAAELDLVLDLEYTSLPLPEERDIERRLLITESMHLALPRDHPLAAESRVRVGELSGEPWLSGLRPSSCGEVIVHTCRDAGFDPRIAFESDDYGVLQGYVAAGLGFTLLPEMALPTLHPDVVVRPTVPEAPGRRVWAATRAKGARSPTTEAMIEFLLAAGRRFADQAAVAAA